MKKIESICEKKDAKNPFYGESKTIYFRVFELTKQQREDLLDMGRQKIDLCFVVEDTATRSEKTDSKYLRLRVIGLRKSESDESLAPSDTF